MIVIKLIFTNHATEKMDGLGITRAEVEATIRQGKRWEERPGVWHATMAGVEVVFQLQGDNMIIITTYYEGKR